MMAKGSQAKPDWTTTWLSCRGEGDSSRHPLVDWKQEAGSEVQQPVLSPHILRCGFLKQQLNLPGTHLQLGLVSRAGHLRAQPLSHPRGGKAHTLQPAAAAVSGVLAGSRMECRAARTRLALPIRDAIMWCAFNLHTTMPAPQNIS